MGGDGKTSILEAGEKERETTTSLILKIPLKKRLAFTVHERPLPSFLSKHSVLPVGVPLWTISCKTKGKIWA